MRIMIHGNERTEHITYVAVCESMCMRYAPMLRSKYIQSTFVSFVAWLAKASK